MIGRTSLLGDLRRRLRHLEQDLAERADSDPGTAAALEAEYRTAREAGRTGDTFRSWRNGALTQAAVAWLLGCVFVRFAEDNGLIESPLIAGPGGRNARAADRQTLYFRARPTDSDNDYLLDVFAEAARLPAMARLYEREHNPVWRHRISGDAARDLIAFWRAVDPDTGALRHDFTDHERDTRFLGDLYQDLSDEAKKRFALLQTPEFVEEFILDRTLAPALDEFGLGRIRLIDPACGSGHFLLGAFRRLLRAWFTREPGTPERVLVQRALDGVHGVDVNPFAAAIARFRLLAAALRASRIERLEDTPAFEIHVAAGDSLLHGRRFGELDLGGEAEQLAGQEGFGHAFLAEDLDALNRILGQRYHVVVGNPPYVTVKDKAVNRLYRDRYDTCYMKYALSAPFAERFFDLAIRGGAVHSAGYVAQITSNSFMKREFGRKMIENLFPTVDLTHVIDTSGAYIPGHGTPTVILIGRNRSPISDSVRAVLGIRGEPETPADPANGKVWKAVLTQIDSPGSESEWISVADVAHDTFHQHPWSIGGGGTQALQDWLESASSQILGDIAVDVGITAVTGEDGLFIAGDAAVARRLGVEHTRRLVIGDNVRDWTASFLVAVWLYDDDFRLFDLNNLPGTARYFWRYRTSISSRKRFGTPMLERGLTWYEYQELYTRKLRRPLSITFAFVSTHNHFVLDRGGKIFKQSAPVIKLSANTTDADHIALTGILNSSVACFWMKQVFHNKGSTVDTHGARQTTDAFEDFYEYAGTGLKKFPLPANRPNTLAEALDRLAAERQTHLPAQLADRFPMAPAELDAHRDIAANLLARMIALQEELDWECYRLYGVIDEDCRYAGQMPADGYTAATPTDLDATNSSFGIQNALNQTMDSRFRGNDGQYAGMTASVKVTHLAEMTSFPRKRESISVSESRNLSTQITAAADHAPSTAPAPAAPTDSNTSRAAAAVKRPPSEILTPAIPEDPPAAGTGDCRESPPSAPDGQAPDNPAGDSRHLDQTPPDGHPSASPGAPDVPTTAADHTSSEPSAATTSTDPNVPKATAARAHLSSEMSAPATSTPTDPHAPDTGNRREPSAPAPDEPASRTFISDHRHTAGEPASGAPHTASEEPDSDADASNPGNHRQPPPLALGERAFEIVMARRMAAGELETTWFTRHGSTPITELPAHWPADYRALVERRIELIHGDRFIGLLEKPEYKRRWNTEPWHTQEQRALRNWLLDRLESPACWPELRLATVRTLAERAATDTDFQQVATRYTGHQGVDLEPLIADLVESESVPALPAQRYKPSGLAKRADWERTWALQRREDEIDAEVATTLPRRDTETEEAHAARIEAEQHRRKQDEIGSLPPPPKYRSADFRKPGYWRLRGALDVPKERFVSFPQMSRDTDPTLLVAWAGWNPLELCRAVAAYSTEVTERDGWPPERLAPLLAVIQENLPWLKQWHNEIDPEYDQRLGDFFETFLHTRLSELGLTEDDLRSWTPAKSGYK